MIVTDLSNSFNPCPKNKRIKNKKLLQDKKGICQVCGKKGATEKHHFLKTKGAGGNDEESNLIELCRICHRLAHDGKITKQQLKRVKEINDERNLEEH